MMIRELMVYWFAIIAVGFLLVWKSPLKTKTEFIDPETTDETKSDVSVNSELKSESDYLRQGKRVFVRADNFDPSEHASVKEMLFSTQCITLYIVAIFTAFSGFFALSQSRNFGVINGYNNDAFLAFIPSIGALFGGMRFFWSWSLDHSNFKKIYGIVLVTDIFLNFTIFFADKSPYTYAIWIWLFTFSEAGMFVLLPNQIKRTFGSKAT